MTNNFDDDLRRQLSSLEGDVQPLVMPGPAAARKRAAQRTRNQITGSVLGGVAVIAAGVAITVGGTFGAAPPEPAVTPTDDVTAEPTPSEDATTAPATPEPLPSEALMAVEHIADGAGIPWAAGDAAPDPQCAPALGDLDVQRSGRADFTGGTNLHYSQQLLELAPGTAEAAFAEVRDRIKACVPTEHVSGLTTLPRYLDEFTVEQVGDEAWGFRYFAEPGGEGGATIVTVGLVRSADLLSFTVRTTFGQDAVGPPDYVTPANAAEAACTALYDTSCVDEPTPVGLGDYPDLGGEDPTGDDTGAGTDTGSDTGTTDPGTDPTNPTDDPTTPANHVLADDPFLTDDQLNPIGQRDFFATNPSREPSPYDLMCLEPVSGIGEDDSRSHYWNPESEGSVDEIALQFPDWDDASNWLNDHTAIAQKCPEIADNPEQELNEVGVIPVDGADEALAWTILDSPPEADTTFFGVGMARRGNIVVVLTYWAQGGDPGDWQGYITQTLGTALDQAIAE